MPRSRFGANKTRTTGGGPSCDRSGRHGEGQLKPADVKAIGLSGQMHGSVFLDKNDRVIRPAILWNDQRTAAECAEIEQRVGGRAKLIELVANPAYDRLHGPQNPLAAQSRAEAFRQNPKILLPKDEIRRRLTGEYATEVSDASGMLLLDVARRRGRGNCFRPWNSTWICWPRATSRKT